MRTTRFFMTIVAMVAAVALMAAPASAQPQQNGLVNVNLENIDIGVPIAVAANICDVDVNVIAEARHLGETACTADAESGAVFGPSQGGSSPRQEGLVNVNVSDVVVKVPISVAANICDVAVNVLAQQREAGNVTCDAVADSNA